MAIVSTITIEHESAAPGVPRLTSTWWAQRPLSRRAAANMIVAPIDA
ncbi:MAG TPA: hypothetical protein VER03_25920 [Bryobacteraceae bacterium]|nr:hypothetical protein [Bryobacteraceae bacterium]